MKALQGHLQGITTERSEGVIPLFFVPSVHKIISYANEPIF